MNEEKNYSAAKSSPLGAGRHSLYFIGIGGIGMSAIARYFNTQGVKVSGYDKTATVLTKQLEAEGINIHYEENLSLIPKEVDLVVYTPAVPANHAELQFYQNNGYKVVKRSDVLKIITESSFNICVAGTHGKTTVSTMIAHILRHTSFGCNAFLGGISANYQTNFWSDKKNVCVIEADEYDRSFLKLSPDVAVITAMDPDHLDIYGTAEEFENAFIDFSKKVKKSGILITKFGLSRSEEFTADKQLTYSLNDTNADAYAGKIKVENGSYVFDVTVNDWSLKDVTLHMGGLHNIENIVAAICVAKQLGIDDQKIKSAVADFKGVRRRFEYVVKNAEHVLIDDYAHHPEELRALIGGVRSLFEQDVVMVFQPHLFSRTKDQAEGFAEVLDLCDEVVLLPIYPARELPMEGVSSEMILEKMTIANKKVLSKDAVKNWIKKSKPKLLVMAGAGDIDLLIQEVKVLLESQ
ncbi:UDP-N-acetylmuramate--L-alanine ligase [Segetibacter aerophilus]|uniref:UDP-N-acetylmuramate--L-alanine ligase n=1 Tax=Segetibacter aerophilus TaxID=670293 RepID=A0A512BEA1_9BACT|nr:UDP-N-acetylmuramate--L-alanine ligase [Segetibacter aerophilus]GEO10293.1 UDP-N-acetylmuramate--L-alanine ligase [Segetibacter aerophilus]